MPRPAWVEELKKPPSDPRVREALEVRAVLSPLEGKTIQAVKIASAVLNDDIWLILEHGFISTDGLACYYPEEIPLLRDKTLQDLREIHKVKLAFPGCRVIQEAAEPIKKEGTPR